MTPRIDLTGRVFGKLTVKYIHSVDHRKYVRWFCECSCGNTSIVIGSHLIRGNTKTCGCSIKEHQKLAAKAASLKNTKPYGLSAKTTLYKNYKRHAIDRSLVFEITLEEFEVITQRDCYYCGVAPIQISKSANNRLVEKGLASKDTGNYIYNGIDRLDNKRGYTIDNIVSCCKMCNHAKKTYTEDEFREWIKRVYNHWIKEE